ncbi:phospholipid-translocating ATPase [Tothia fuscella]|uniref:Phospholipid-transporting ATPase n=1 Tax=Tothia fuscella TaxID=1048955 RepID=A0A9P4NL25_9PEZI|nr:phospholipid-translocating ATPase [Tothia fuscella]
MVPPEPEDSKSLPNKRIRWATRRVTGQTGDRKRESLLARAVHKRAASSASKRGSKRVSTADTDPSFTKGDEVEGEGSEESDQQAESGGRRIFFNIPLPDDARDEDGHPIASFSRNKIRTAKYTPISFLPKNLWFQFHNIANVYFLFIIILGIFSIFGASNPGLNAVPLIVILFVTAVKDGIEDWRRTVLDNELNNAPVHLLVDFNNVNTAEDHISIWRRFKKVNSAFIRTVWGLWKKRKTPREEKGKSYAERATDETRPSIETRMSHATERTSFHTVRSSREDGEAIQMTPVPSPLPGQRSQLDESSYLGKSETPDGIHSENDTPRKGGTTVPPSRYFGNIVNPLSNPPEKARFKKDYWKNVKVGDFVRLYDGEEVPADLVVLSTSDADGACYIETKNLDGETNLKVRNALHCSRTVKHARHCEMSDFYIESEGPAANLYSYSGVLRWTDRNRTNPDATGTEMAEAININNLLPRGASIRNTEWVMAVVIFTGRETKIMLNSGITPSKRAKISRDLNWNVIYNFIVLSFMCLVSGIVQGVTWGRQDTSHSLFEFGSYGGNVPALDGFITFWAAVILFQNLVPISLYITLEIIRTLQAVFIYSDVNMYYEKIDYPCTPKSWNISDDLGQIEYIFSDKTGTLTQNVMEFKKATVNGVPYGEAYTEALAGMQRRQGVDVEVEGAKARKQIAEDRIVMLERLEKLHSNPYLREDDLTFIAPDFIADLAGDGTAEQKAANAQFLLALALCHTVIAERTGGETPKVEFKAQSPDEAALVATARDCGYTVLGSTNDKLVVNILGEKQYFEVLVTLEFNSTRKRMSAIIRMPNGKIILFCKGADSMIYSRLKAGEQAELRKSTAEHLEMFAREGLRTLCIAQREIPEDEFQSWYKLHEEAASSVQDREDKLERVSDTIERDLTLLGGTAIEDRLQDGVPDAIQLLGRAGIKLWVLTGDKVETAINIGFSCNLLDNEMDLIVFDIQDENMEAAEAQLDQNLKLFGMVGSDEELKAAQTNHEPPAPTHAIVIDGESLKLVLDDTLRQKFLLLCKQCKAVLCCRVSPSQKAQVVNMVKTGLDCLTLAIGDGANDVAMIQEAHVGVGIAGEEGRQAVMSSDYAIGQFRFLCRLLLVHGRWSYRRLAETIANFFYKNLVWTFALFWFQIFDNFDIAYVYDYTYIILYNLAFTSLPVILMGVLDQDVDDKVSLAVPQLYRRGIERKEWTQPKFWTYMLDGLYQSAIVFFMAYLLFSPANFVTGSGLDVGDTKRFGIFIASTAVVVVNLYILNNTYRWDWLMLLIVAISILLIWFWTGVWTVTTAGFTFHGAAAQVYGTLNFWALLLMTVIACLLPRFVVKATQKIYFPRDADIIREQIREGRFDYLKNNDSFASPPPEKVEMLEQAPSRVAETEPKRGHHSSGKESEDLRPIYPPSVAATQNTHGTHTQNGSDGTDYTGHSFEAPPVVGSAMDRQISRPSFDRARMSMDRIRPSFEQSHDFTSASRLMRLESSQSGRGIRWKRRLTRASETSKPEAESPEAV